MKSKKIIWLFLVLLPWIDLITSIATWEKSFSIGLILKGLFLIYAIFYIWKNSSLKRKKVLALLAIFLAIQLGIFYGTNSSGIFTEIISMTKIFYFPILVLFFSVYQNELVNKKLIVYLATTFLFLYLLPYPFNLGHNLSEIYPNKYLYLSYFYVGNELANIFILLLPVAFEYFIDKKSKLLIPFGILTIFMLLLLGTKTMYLSVLILVGYFIWHYRLDWKERFQCYRIYFISGFIGLVILIGIFIPRSDFYQNIKTTLDFYQVDSLKDVFNLETIDNIVYSNRLDFLKDVHQVYQDSSWDKWIFGIGKRTINTIKDIEIDMFDIFYAIGIYGTILYIGLFVFAVKTANLKGIYQFIFYLMLIISCFTGHILLSPMTSTYLAILVGVNKNERGNYEKLHQKSVKKIKNSLDA